jgi:2-methylisocitrate lyase-like PEP mutase family enzyme
MSARLIEASGFDVAYISGAWTAALRGFPDAGIVSWTEMLETARLVADAVDIPVVADADAGFGSPSTIWRAIRDLERGGLAGVQIEDQTDPKRCGLLAGKAVVTPREMVTRILVAVEARRSDDFVIIARTDALAAEGMEAVIQRGHAYFEAGADALFVEAFQTRAQIDAIGEAFGGRSLVFNRTPRGHSPMVPVAELEAAGYGLVIFPMHLVLAAAGVGQRMLREIRESGTSDRYEELMMSVEDFFELVGQSRITDLENAYGGMD